MLNVERRGELSTTVANTPVSSVEFEGCKSYKFLALT
jgi:hypothetical protein